MYVCYKSFRLHFEEEITLQVSDNLAVPESVRKGCPHDNIF